VSGMVPFEIAFVSPPLVSRKFPHVPLGLGGWLLGCEGRRVGLIDRAISFQDSNLCGPYPPTLQTDGRTDRRHAIAIPHFAL